MMGASRELAELASSYTSGGLSNMRNRIINGAMGISQRGTSFTTSLSSITYTLDRWSATPTGANVTIAQVAGIGGFQNALQITGAASNTQVYVSQRIESVNIADLAGTTATLSAVMQASTNNTVLWSAYYPNARDNYSSFTFIAQGTFSVTTSAQTFSAQINLPAQAANGLWILFYPNTAGAFTSGTLTITGVQLEKGSTATTFDYRPYGTELQLCQRYYYRIAAGTAGQIFGSGFNQSTTTASVVVPLPVQMRAAPSALEQTGTAADYRVNNLATATTCSSVPVFAVTTANVAYVAFTTGASLVAGQGIAGSCTNTSAFLAWSAEL